MLLDSSNSAIRILPPPAYQISGPAPVAFQAPFTPAKSGGSYSSESSHCSSMGQESPLIAARLANNSRTKVAKERILKVPRPPNAFILYRQHHHPLIKARRPEIHNNEICKAFHPQFLSSDSDKVQRS